MDEAECEEDKINRSPIRWRTVTVPEEDNRIAHLAWNSFFFLIDDVYEIVLVLINLLSSLEINMIMSLDIQNNGH